MIALKKLTVEQTAILVKRLASHGELSPQQKFQVVKKSHDTKKVKIKQWHFFGIEHGIEIYLFNGLGKQLGVFDNSFNGKRDCRRFAFEMFKEAEFSNENINGGYRFDFIQ